MSIDLPIYPRPIGARVKNNSPKRATGNGTDSNSTGNASLFHGFTKSFDGTKLFYSVEGSGKPLIFCYGLICSSLHWTYQIDYFKNKYQAVWFDYRGHHNSDAPADLKQLTLKNIALDLKAVLDELEIKDAVLLGHSMGVNVVLEFYRQNPERVAGLVLANGTAKRPLETVFGQNLFQIAFKTLKRLYDASPELVSLFFRLQKGNPIARSIVALCGFNPHLTPKADIELYIEQVAKTDPAILIRLIEDYEAFDATAWLHTIAAPTLIIAGEHDRVIPIEQQELIHQLIPNSSLEIIRHGSHCPQMDLPDLVNVKIDQFLNRIGYGSVATPSKETANRSTGRLEFPEN